MIVLSIEDKLNYLEQPIPPAPVAPEGQQVGLEIFAAHTAWIKGSKEIVGLMFMTMKLEIQLNMENLHAHEILLELKTLFTQQAEQELLQTTLNFHSCKQEEGQSYLAELLKKKKNTASRAGGSGIFVIELNTILNKSWIYDTGYGTHIFNTTQGLGASRKLNSMYVVSNKRAKLDLDSALLWHCRLRHISKKRIEKLQHDGLLNSTDLWAFEKCISFMSGKMARKPYTHQVKKAKDLLGLIHTDHKHEVFKTFKVFQKEVENQLCKTIKSLRSDRGGEYTSQEFLDHLKDHGYPKKTMGYSFYYPPKNKVLVARNAEFLKNSLIIQEASGSLEDLEIIQEEDTHPSIETSLNHEEDDQEIDEPQRDLGEPANYKAALLDPESDTWLNAMNVEMKSMKDNKVWDLVELSPYGKTFGSKWLFKQKTDMDGAIHIYKARLVAKGYTQTPWIDYEETFSPVADIRAIRILIAIVAFYDYEIWQIDVKTAFLNGYLFEERYHMDNSKRGSTPMQEKFRLSKSQGDLHWTTVKNIMKYLRNTKDMFLVYGGDIKRELMVSCYTDAGYLTDADDLKSQIRYVFVLNGGVVDWKSAKQSIFATLSA
nr:retrotransposon protein, putative, Ty1-copia subclass [Tanacetum cinerariifolium]